MNTLKNARAYFTEFTNSTNYSGFVYFAPGNRKPSGWVNELNDPSRFEPGVTFIDISNGTPWQTTGGNCRDGAKSFVRCIALPSLSVRYIAA